MLNTDTSNTNCDRKRCGFCRNRGLILYSTYSCFGALALLQVHAV